MKSPVAKEDKEHGVHRAGVGERDINERRLKKKKITPARLFPNNLHGQPRPRDRVPSMKLLKTIALVS